MRPGSMLHCKVISHVAWLVLTNLLDLTLLNWFTLWELKILHGISVSFSKRNWRNQLQKKRKISMQFSPIFLKLWVPNISQVRDASRFSPDLITKCDFPPVLIAIFLLWFFFESIAVHDFCTPLILAISRRDFRRRHVTIFILISWRDFSLGLLILRCNFVHNFFITVCDFLFHRLLIFFRSRFCFRLLIFRSRFYFRFFVIPDSLQRVLISH